MKLYSSCYLDGVSMIHILVYVVQVTEFSRDQQIDRICFQPAKDLIILGLPAKDSNLSLITLIVFITNLTKFFQIITKY